MPPRCFFPDPKPDNLITVPCCRDCNNGKSKDDEAVRAFFAAATDCSPAGRTIWAEKVIGGTVKHSPAFLEEMLSRVREAEVRNAGRRELLPALVVPDERVNPFVTRVAKGLLTAFYPELDYGNHVFDVRFLVPSQTTLENLAPLLATARHDSRGQGVFRVSHQVTGTRRGGFCFQVYYETICYLVLHTRKEPIHSVHNSLAISAF